MKGDKWRRCSRSACAAVGVVTALAVAGPAGPAGAAGTSGAASHPAVERDTWPTFGHDPLHSGVSPDSAIGASTAPGLAVLWSQSLGTANDQPSPAVAYDASLKQTLVYDATYAGRVSAFNATTGALVWHRQIGTNVYSSPAVYGNTVYFGDNNGALEALNAATGAVQCTFTLPVVPPSTAPGKIFSSPVVGNVDGTGPTVFFGDANIEAGGHVWAVTGFGNTAGNCQEKWAYDTWANKGKTGAMTGVWGEPALAQEQDGIWAVVVGSSNPDDSVYAVNAVTGARLWHFRTVTSGTDEDVGAGPAISAPGGNGFADGVVYVEGKDGIEYALNLRTGQEIWSFTLGPGSADAISVAEAALTGDTLVTAYAGSVFALNATTGAQVWETTLGGTIQASPAVSGGPGDQAVFAGDLDGHEYGLSLADGTQLFSVATKGKVIDSTAVADGTIYFAGGGKLYAYAPPG